MKNILLIIMSMLLLSCASTPKIYYQEDVFYPQNSEYNTDWLGGGSDVNYRFIKRANNKIYLQARLIYDKSFYVENTDTIDLKFTNGSIISLDYDGVIGQPRSYNFNDFYILTKLEEIKEWGELELRRVETSLGYDNIKVHPNFTDKMSDLYNRVKNNEYDEVLTEN